jgi:hypothetical protein
MTILFCWRSSSTDFSLWISAASSRASIEHGLRVGVAKYSWKSTD